MGFLKSSERVLVYVIVWALLFFLISAPAAAEKRSGGGQWKHLIKKNWGVSTVNMALLHNNKVLIFEHSDFDPSNISLPFERSKYCWAHSIEYDVVKKKLGPFQIQTDTWCSSGGIAVDNRLVQTGSTHEVYLFLRTLSIPCNFCDTIESRTGLANRRLYASHQILPDGRIIIVGGRRQFNYEFIPKDRHEHESVYEFPFLQETMGANGNNLYPFVHLAPDGNLFIFANTRSILFDYVNNRVVRRYPDMPGSSRNYPSSGSSVLLPLDVGSGDAEVLICGGGAATSYSEAIRGNYLTASNTCGRLKFTDPDDPEWRMEKMPMPRVMGDMLLLPTGDVLIMNGASKGSAGWDLARDPVLYPLLYNPLGSSFEVLTPSDTPRLYHSSCNVLPDGRVLVGAGNRSSGTLDAFSPPYLATENDEHRPFIASLVSDVMGYGRNFTLIFFLESLDYGTNEEIQQLLSVTILAPSFTTHGYSMNQRLVRLQFVEVHSRSGIYRITVKAPPTGAFAPPGYYLLFVVHSGIPSQGKWVKLIQIDQ